MITMTTWRCAADDRCGVGLLRWGTWTQRWQRGWQVYNYWENSERTDNRGVTKFMQLALMISWERENLFQKGRPFCPWIRRVPVAGPGLEKKLNSFAWTVCLARRCFHIHSFFAGASIFKSLPSVWQQLEGDFHCRLGRGKGSLLFWNTPSWRNPLHLITETLGYQHHQEKMNYVTFCRELRDLWTRQRQFTCGTIGARWFR